ncbi:amidohydrolase [Streptacidiphilus rugosus]|uniref:amidohydrolase n=1 Tax=Streptacidiphilus rugosus TaxID=405783 RepID=UPI00056A54B0|nr:amidohydrolase [Streptacidiphilus rugosus]
MANDIDILFVGGPVLTMDAARTRATAVAVRNGRVLAVGHDDLRELAGPGTEIVDLRGRALLPGFQDAHVHAVYAGVEMGECDLTGATDLGEYRRRIAEYAAAQPTRPWITGAGWSMEAFDGGLPSRAQLDEIVPDRPVFLLNRDHHGAWANTRALELAGLTADTPDPADGRIEREPDGTPGGMLQEGATVLVARMVPKATVEDRVKGLLRAQAHLHSLGITAWQDAILGVFNGQPDVSDAYLAAASDGRLTARVNGALWWDRERGAEQIPELVARRDKLTAGRFRAGSVKIMQDGIAENFTAAMTVPYKDACGCTTSNAGLSFVDPVALRSHVTELDALGFQVHFHALGDRAVREALDAVEAAIEANGHRDNRHHLAHLQVVHPDDVPRFARLGAIANLQPLWAAHEPQMDALCIPFLGGELASWQYPFGDLLRAGATLAAGSDWPVSSPNPWEGIHVAVNRVNHGDDREVFLPEQRLDLTTAIAAYTAGSAHVNHLEDAGVIRPGAFADLTVVDRDPFAVPAKEIGATRVEQTFVGGERVFSAGR